ncbi:MAG: DUF1667 domain-containing protein [Chloroflexi bacterium]|nr:DUF1667 domain-containing protein [Chloroflexota bacterium]
MKGKFVCVVCPTSCDVNAEWNETELLSIDHAQCKLAWEFIRGEIFDPRRTVTTSIMVDGGELPLVSVKTRTPVPKAQVLAVMDRLADVMVRAPVDIGEVIVPDVLGTGSDVVATRKVKHKG